MAMSYRADMEPGSWRWNRLSHRQQIAYRWLWWQDCTSVPWYIWHEFSHPAGATIEPTPTNLGTQLGYSGA